MQDSKEKPLAIDVAVPDGFAPWSGGERPVPGNTKCQVIFRHAVQRNIAENIRAGSLWWGHQGAPSDIVAYRIVEETPGLVNLDTVRHERKLELDLSATTLCRTEDFDFLEGDASPVMAFDDHEAITFHTLEQVGDITSDAKGSGARYNSGKPPLDLIPLSVIVPYYRHPLINAEQITAIAALDSLGMFQARVTDDLHAVLLALGDGWAECAHVFDFGRKKYAAWNWAKGMNWSVPIGCAARHLMAIITGETNDQDSGLPHRGHVFCNIVMLLTYRETFTEGDDRPAKGLLL